MKKIIATTLALLLFSAPALAGTGSTNYNSSGSTPFQTGTNGNSNNSATMNICDVGGTWTTVLNGCATVSTFGSTPTGLALAVNAYVTGTVTANIGTGGGLATSATQGATTDAPCTLPATTTACSQIALEKASANGINAGSGIAGSATGATPSVLLNGYKDGSGNYQPFIGTTNGIYVDGSHVTQPVSGNLGGFNVIVANTPTVTASAYTANNAIGGLQTVALFRSTAQPSGVLNNELVASKGGISTGIALYGFTKSPASTCTDHSAFVLSSTDLPYLIPGFPVTLTPAATAGTTQTTAFRQSPVSVNNQDGSPTVNLYFCAVSTGTPTPASTTDLVFSYSMVRD